MSKKSTYKPGDSSFIASAMENVQAPERSKLTFAESDIPGYVHPVINGSPDKTQYIAAAAAEAAAQSGSPPLSITREQALRNKS
jgi:hypothetical protein